MGDWKEKINPKIVIGVLLVLFLSVIISLIVLTTTRKDCVTSRLYIVGRPITKR